MAKTPNYLGEAKIHEGLGGICGWAWILGSWAAIGLLMAALLGHASRWVATLVLVGSQFCRPVAREYNKAAQKAIYDGVATGQIVIGPNNQAMPAGVGSTGPLPR